MTLDQINERIQYLESQLIGDMMIDMDLRDEIHNLKMKSKGIKPLNQEIDCVGCGS